MLPGLVHQFIGLLVRPGATLASLRDTPIRSAFAWFLGAWAIFAVLFTLVDPRFHPDVPGHFTRALFVVMVLLGWLYFGLFIHGFLRLVSGPKNLEQTYRAVYYSATPLAAIGWVPYLNGLSVIWGLVIVTRGIMEYQGISRRSAFVVTFLSLLVGIPLIFVLWLFFLTWAMVIEYFLFSMQA